MRRLRPTPATARRAARHRPAGVGGTISPRLVQRSPTGPSCSPTPGTAPRLTNTYGSRRLADILGIGPRDFCHKWRRAREPRRARRPTQAYGADAERADAGRDLPRRRCDAHTPVDARRWRLGGAPPPLRLRRGAQRPAPISLSIAPVRELRASLPARSHPPPHVLPREGEADGPPPGGGDADRTAAGGLPRRRRTGCPTKPTSWRLRQT